MVISEEENEGEEEEEGEIMSPNETKVSLLPYFILGYVFMLVLFQHIGSKKVRKYYFI